MRLAWVTDVHLNFLSDDAICAFGGKVRATGADAVVLTGDISEAPSIVEHLDTFGREAGMPIHFVLGNHDFYRGSLGAVRDSVRKMGWLPEQGVVELSPTSALLGCDGWGDARYGDYKTSDVMLNDFLLIEDLRTSDKEDLASRLRAEGDRWGDWVREHLPPALEKYERIVFATHVPPFDRACWHDGKMSDANWLPYFTCKAVGDALLECVSKHPNTQITVLCGHTHSPGRMRAAQNLEVRTGGAAYGTPHVQEVLELA